MTGPVSGNLRKMLVQLDQPVRYTLLVGDNEIELNQHIGQSICLNYLDEINCIHCGRKTNKSFGQGYCFPCFRDLAECDGCIVRPETCHYDQGTCRDPEWGKRHCFQDHTVYLANSSGVKVGITRGSQIPTRWIDQGATQGLPIFRVKNRLQSGLVEVALKQHVSDRTDWRKMLKGDADSVSLAEFRDELTEKAADALADIKDQFDCNDIEFLPGESEVAISFPVAHFPEKVKSLNFDKTPLVEGILQGIKGQYLILDAGVINIRKFGGYKVEFSAKNLVSNPH